MTEGIRVVIADDHPLYREGLLQSLNTEGITVVAEAATAAEALEQARETLPDVLLLDISMPGQSGLDILSDLQRDVPVCKVMIVTVSDDEETLFGALKRGACGYIVKGVTAEELLLAVRAVHAGETYVSPSMAGRILTDMAQHRPAGLPGLSAREQDILERIAQGQANKEIAAALSLSEKTVKHYVTNILAKLQVRNRVEAAVKARSGGSAP